MRPFAAAIFALSTARADESLSLTRFQDARIREAISTLIRKACDVVYPALRVPEVSVAADAAARGLGIDLRRETWHSQKKFDPGYKVFHYEHMQPVGAILAAAVAADSADKVLDVLRRDLRLAWITKDENKALNALGFASKRPHPDAAYKAAGIQLCPDPAVGAGATEATDLESEIGQASNAVTPPAERQQGANHDSLPPIVAGSTSTQHDQPNEPGFMPVAAGDNFITAQLGLCLGGQVQLYTEAGASLWSTGEDSTLFEAQCRAFLARTPQGEEGFREACLFNAATGTLLLQPRFPDTSETDGEGALSFDVAPVQLAPPAGARDSWSNDLQTLLARAVGHTLGGGGQLRIEAGGWGSSPAPFCSVEIAFSEDHTPLLYLEASPVPGRSRWWKERMSAINESTARLVVHAKDFNPDQAALLVRDALDWEDVSPWDLVLTYREPPKTRSTVAG